MFHRTEKLLCELVTDHTAIRTTYNVMREYFMLYDVATNAITNEGM